MSGEYLKISQDDEKAAELLYRKIYITRLSIFTFSPWKITLKVLFAEKLMLQMITMQINCECWDIHWMMP